MIKLLANRVLEFHGPNGEKEKTKIGFCELPNWVGETPLYKLAVAGGEISVFDKGEDENAVKLQENKTALLDEIKGLEEKLEQVKTKGDEKVQGIKDEIANLEAEKVELEKAVKQLREENARKNQNRR